jgi:hypothetical protein
MVNGVLVKVRWYRLQILLKTDHKLQGGMHPSRMQTPPLAPESASNIDPPPTGAESKLLIPSAIRSTCPADMGWIDVTDLKKHPQKHPSDARRSSR